MLFFYLPECRKSHRVFYFFVMAQKMHTLNINQSSPAIKAYLTLKYVLLYLNCELVALTHKKHELYRRLSDLISQDSFIEMVTFFFQMSKRVETFKRRFRLKLRTFLCYHIFLNLGKCLTKKCLKKLSKSKSYGIF